MQCGEVVGVVHVLLSRGGSKSHNCTGGCFVVVQGGYLGQPCLGG